MLLISLFFQAIFFLLFLPVKAGDYISWEYFTTNNQYYFSIYFGSKKSYLVEGINQKVQENILILVTNYLEISNTLQIISNDSYVNFNNTRMPSIYGSDVIFTKDRSWYIDKIYFQLMKYRDVVNFSSFKEGFTFAYKIKDWSHSITHILYNNKSISSLSYAIEPKNDKDGTFHIGMNKESIPMSVLRIFKHENTIKVLPEKPTWGNILSFIRLNFNPTPGSTNTIDSEITVIKQYFYFNTEEIDIIVPRWFFEKLLKRLQNIDPTCHKKTGKSLYWYNIFCGENQFENDFSGIDFIIDRHVFTLNVNEIVNCFWSKCIFIIGMHINDTGDMNDWVFGSGFMKKYFMIFSYEDNEIWMYSKDMIEEYEHDDKGDPGVDRLKSAILFVVWTANMICILYLIYVKKKLCVL